MKKAILCAVLVMFALGAVAIAQTATPKPPPKWNWAEYQAQTTDEARLVWLTANVPDSQVTPESRIEWVTKKADIAEFLGKIDSQEAYFKQFDADGARAGLRNNPLFQFRKAFLLLQKFNDTTSAEAVALEIRDNKIKLSLMSQIYSAAQDWEKLLPVAKARSDFFLTFRCYDHLIASGKSTDKDALFENGKKALDNNFAFDADAREVLNTFIKTDWTGSKVTKQIVLDTLKAYRKTVPPIKTEAMFLEGWSKLAGDLDLQIQLLEVEVAKQAAAKKQTATKQE